MESHVTLPGFATFYDAGRRPATLLGFGAKVQPPSSSGLGHHPLKVAARVRIPLGVLLLEALDSEVE